MTGICNNVALRNHPEEANSMNHSPLAKSQPTAYYLKVSSLVPAPLSEALPPPLTDTKAMGRLWDGCMTDWLVGWLAWHRHCSWNLLVSPANRRGQRSELINTCRISTTKVFRVSWQCYQMTHA